MQGWELSNGRLTDPGKGGKAAEGIGVVNIYHVSHWQNFGAMKWYGVGGAKHTAFHLDTAGQLLTYFPC